MFVKKKKKKNEIIILIIITIKNKKTKTKKQKQKQKNSLRIPTALFIFPVRVFTSTFGGIAKWRCKLKYFLEQSVARFMAVGCSGKWCVSLVNLNDCNDSKIGRSLVSLSVVLGGRSFYHDAVLRDPAVDSVTFDPQNFWLVRAYVTKRYLNLKATTMYKWPLYFWTGCQR